MAKKKVVDTNGDMVLDLKGAAALFGWSEDTTRYYARTGQIPGRRVGKKWIFSRNKLLRFAAGEDE